MPYIGIKVSSEVSAEKELALKSALGQIITKIPGKSESGLMICIDDGQKMYFRGNNDAPSAYAEVKIYGKSTPEAYGNMTAAMCEAFETILGVPQDRTYIKYEECYIWGWNGKNI
ncbi:MAG: phenylpyruvate tautomerase MIF-related protein [Eubacteriales bacterium]|jgi:phenylpyruvate tautomerase PptA (4-oxalocrotonate tautomerase family)|nr:phenylpyruvate tautomerase MIF-related protein [Eubacteriales bacterium]